MPSSSRLPSAERATTSTTVTRSWTIETPSAVRPYEVVCSVRSPATLTSTTVEQTATAPPMNSASISGQPRAKPGGGPDRHREGNLQRRAGQDAGPDAAELIEAELEADAEHQQRHADVGERQHVLLRGNDPRCERTDGQTGGDVADHRRDAETMSDGPEDESRCERDEQSQLEGHRRLGGMCTDHTGRSRWPTLPPMLGGDTLSILEIFVVLVAAATVVAIVARRTILPYSVGLVFLGLAVSALQPPLDLEIAPDVLLAVLIPGLIFEAAYRIDLRDLMPNLPAITVLATVGVLVTAATVALMLNVATGLSFSLAFLVGTMLAATDPAAVIAVFSRLRAPRRLTTLVEAESLFNDGTGIVIFAIAVESFGRDVAPVELVVGVAVTTVVSTAIGVALGFIATRVLRRLDDHLIELTISLVAAYGSYLLAERFDQSGILATVACGLVFGSLGRRATSARAEDAIDTVWEFIAFLDDDDRVPAHRPRDQHPAAQGRDRSEPLGPGRPARLARAGRVRAARRRFPCAGSPRMERRDADEVAAPDRLGRAARSNRHRPGAVACRRASRSAT